MQMHSLTDKCLPGPAAERPERTLMMEDPLDAGGVLLPESLKEKQA